MALLLKTVSAARGPRWVGDAFRLFGRRPLGFTALFAVFLFTALLVAQVPLLGGLVQMMALPLLSLGFMVAGQSALLGGPVRPSQFIEPLRTDARRRRALLLLCVSYGIAALLILLLADTVSNHAWARLQALLAKGDQAQREIDALLSEPGVGTAGLLLALLGSALSVPFWHAPALVHWGGQGAAQSLFSSTLAVWRNKGAFVLYMAAWAGVLMLFGIGNVPGVIVTIIFAIPPVIRLTNLGIRQVPTEIVEAMVAFGASPTQLLFKAQLPVARRTIMAGVNQTLMMALSMVVVASMIAVGGLGQVVLRGIGRLDMGIATVGGIGIVLLAIALDRLTQAFATPRLRPAAARSTESRRPFLMQRQLATLLKRSASYRI